MQTEKRIKLVFLQMIAVLKNLRNRSPLEYRKFKEKMDLSIINLSI